MCAKTFSFAMLSDPGRVRAHNEDACAASVEDGVFVVCDGVGGAASGEIASRIAADALLEQMIAARASGIAPEMALRDAIEQANRLVHRQAKQTTAQHGMATTLVSLAFDFISGSTGIGNESEDATGPAEADKPLNAIWLANVGDSRCYRLRDGRLEQLSRDHSLVEEQVRSGEITRAQAEVSPIRNVITRAIGSDAAVVPDIERVDAQHGDLYLLCSDGLTRDLSNSELAEILEARPSSDGDALTAACERMIQAANDKGGGDNITCMLVYVP